MVKQNKNLVSFHIVERESNGQNLITWTYPTLSDEISTYLKSRCLPANQELFFYLRKNNVWIYIKNFLYTEKLFALAVIAEELVPTKYKLVCDILAKQYINTKNPVDLVKLCIKLISGESVSYHENGSGLGLNLKTFSAEVGLKGSLVFHNSKFQHLVSRQMLHISPDGVAKHYDATNSIKDFGLEVILIYNAILLKRRILVYHNDIEKLQEKILPMTYLVTIRNVKEYLVPWVKNITELKGASFYLAGTTEEDAFSNERYCDLYINLKSNQISISKGAKDCFVMAKFHKDLAHSIVQLAESDLSEAKVVEEIRSKTYDVVQQLYSIATSRDLKKILTINDLKSKKYSQPLENFLFNLAVAENIMML